MRTQNYEKSLAHNLYAYVRAGKLDDAVEMCRNAHQPWRAASIRGSLLFQWPAIGEFSSTQQLLCKAQKEAPANERRDDTAMDEDNESWQGNRRRRLWKSASTRAALNVRRLYTILSFLPLTISSRSLYFPIPNVSYMPHLPHLRKLHSSSSRLAERGRTIFGRR